MANKEKKKLSIKQLKNKYRVVQYSTFASEFASIATPYAALAAINWDRWFMTNPDGYKVGIGGAIAMVLISIAVLLVSTKKEDEAKTSGYIAIIIGWFMVGAVFKLLATIMLEIADIMFITGSGLIGAFGLDQVSKSAKKKKLYYDERIKNAQKAKDEEQARYEIDMDDYYPEKKVKVKIKK